MEYLTAKTLALLLALQLATASYITLWSNKEGVLPNDGMEARFSSEDLIEEINNAHAVLKSFGKPNIVLIELHLHVPSSLPQHMTAVPSMYRGFEQLLKRKSFAFYESNGQLAKQEIEAYFASLGQKVVELDLENVVQDNQIGVMRYNGKFLDDVKKLEMKYRHKPTLYILQITETIDQALPMRGTLLAQSNADYVQPQTAYITPYILSGLFFSVMLVLAFIWGVMRMLDLQIQENFSKEGYEVGKYS